MDRRNNIDDEQSPLISDQSPEIYIEMQTPETISIYQSSGEKSEDTQFGVSQQQNELINLFRSSDDTDDIIAHIKAHPEQVGDNAFMPSTTPFMFFLELNICYKFFARDAVMIMIEMIKTGNARLEFIRPSGKTALILACIKGFPDVAAQILLFYSQSPEFATIPAQEDEFGNTAFKLACFYKHDLKRPNPPSKGYVAAVDFSDVLTFLLNGTFPYIDIEILDNLNKTPLMHAIENHQTAIMTILVNSDKSNISQIDSDDNTAFILACFNVAYESANFSAQFFLKLLNSNKALINHLDINHRSGLHLLCDSVDNDKTNPLIMMILNHTDESPDLSVINDFGFSILSLACMRGKSADIITRIIELGNHLPGHIPNNGITALMWLLLWRLSDDSTRYDDGVIMALLASGNCSLASYYNPTETDDIDIDPDSLSTGTALHLACETNSVAIAEEICKTITLGVDINEGFVDNVGRTALMWASEKGMVNVVRAIMDGGNTDVSIVDNDQATALTLTQNPEIIALINRPRQVYYIDTSLTGIDSINTTETTINEFILENLDHIAVQVEELAIYLTRKSTIQHYLHEGTRFECYDFGKVSDPANINRTIPLYHLKQMAIIADFISLDDAKKMSRKMASQLYVLTPKRQIKTVVSDAVLNYGGTYVGASHCQLGHGGTVYTVHVAYPKCCESIANVAAAEEVAAAPEVAQNENIVYVNYLEKKEPFEITDTTTIGDLKIELGGTHIHITPEESIARINLVYNGMMFRDNSQIIKTMPRYAPNMTFLASLRPAVVQTVFEPSPPDEWEQLPPTQLNGGGKRKSKRRRKCKTRRHHR